MQTSLLLDSRRSSAYNHY